jgi:hypothetical protein
MGGAAWFADNWFNILSSVGIIGGLWFTAFSLCAEARTRQIENLLTLTGNHRELWQSFALNPQLARVLDQSANVTKQPVSREEEVFVNLMIQHVNSVFHAIQSGLTISNDGLRRDVREFFSLPVPRAVWQNLKQFQAPSLVEFIEANSTAN